MKPGQITDRIRRQRGEQPIRPRLVQQDGNQRRRVEYHRSAGKAGRIIAKDVVCAPHITHRQLSDPLLNASHFLYELLTAAPPLLAFNPLPKSTNNGLRYALVLELGKLASKRIGFLMLSAILLDAEERV